MNIKTEKQVILEIMSKVYEVEKDEDKRIDLTIEMVNIAQAKNITTHNNLNNILTLWGYLHLAMDKVNNIAIGRGIEPNSSLDTINNFKNLCDMSKSGQKQMEIWCNKQTSNATRLIQCYTDGTYDITFQRAQEIIKK
jgi:hypothetical protein